MNGVEREVKWFRALVDRTGSRKETGIRWEDMKNIESRSLDLRAVEFEHRASACLPFLFSALHQSITLKDYGTLGCVTTRKYK